MSDDIKEIKDEEKEKLAAEQQEESQETTPTNAGEKRGGVVVGLVIIGLGLVFLVTNLTGFQLTNWWALFILIPGIASFFNAWNAYREDGRWSKRARGGILGGTVVILVAFVFLFNLDWGQVWPVFLILVGLSVLFGAWLDR